MPIANCRLKVRFSRPATFRPSRATSIVLSPWMLRKFSLPPITNIAGYSHCYVTMMSDDHLWRGLGYPAIHLGHLPCHFRSADDVSLIIDYARQSEVTSSLSGLVSEAAARGDNVGTDEVTYRPESINSAEIFTAKWVQSFLVSWYVLHQLKLFYWLLTCNCLFDTFVSTFSDDMLKREQV